MDNLFSEDWAIVAVIDPDAYTVATQTSDEIDMTDWEQLAVVTMAGTLGASASIVTAVNDSATSGGSLTAISGKTTTIGGDSPTTGSDSQRVIHVRSSEGNSNARYVKVTMQVTGATSDAGCIVFGKGRHRPAYDNDLASVAEIVN
jgi:hypothetical protein